MLPTSLSNRFFKAPQKPKEQPKSNIFFVSGLSPKAKIGLTLTSAGVVTLGIGYLITQKTDFLQRSYEKFLGKEQLSSFNYKPLIAAGILLNTWVLTKFLTPNSIKYIKKNWDSIKGNGDSYNGHSYNGKKQGYGKLEFANDDVYEGYFSEDKFQGKGTYTSKNGDTYVGDWINGQKHGEGIWKSSDGKQSYEGHYENDNFHGKGTFIYANKDKYIGDWVEGKCNGQGICESTNGKYVGSFFDGAFHGKGTLTYADGNIFKGSFANGVFNGTGTFTLKNGEVYKGQFNRDNKNGYGTWKNSTGEESYEGDWIYREHKYKERTESEDGNTNDDYYVQVEKCGQGKWMNNAGNIYEGEFKDNTFNGQGRMIYEDKSVYEGAWYKGQKHGYGILTTVTKIYEGYWENGYLTNPNDQKTENVITTSIDENVKTITGSLQDEKL